MSAWVPAATNPKSDLRRKRKSVSSWLILIFSILTVIAWLFPLWMSVTTAFKTASEIETTTLTTLPSSLYWGNFTRFWETSEFTQKLINSLIISSCACAITIGLSFLNAVALGVGRIRYHKAILTMCLIAFAVPQEALVFPVYKFAKLTHTYGDRLPLIVILGIIYSAFGTFLLGEVMRTFPRDLIEAALLDGVSMRQMMRHVVYPVLKPAIFTLAAMVFIWNWNEYMMPLILLPTADAQTVPIAIASTFGQPDFGYTPDISWGAAGALLSSAPTVLFFLLFARVIARGITVGRN